MKIYVWGRQTGKTTKALELFVTTPSCVFLTIDNRAAHRCKEILKRWGQHDLAKYVFSHRSKAWRGTTMKNAILDEVDLFESHHLVNIERLFDIVAIFTSPKYRYGWSWLQEKIYDYNNEYHRMPTQAIIDDKEYLARMKKCLSKQVFAQEFMAKPDEMDPLQWERFWNQLLEQLPRPIDVAWFKRQLIMYKRDCI